MEVAHLLRARESKEALLDRERLPDFAADLECDAFDLVREAVLELLESEAGKAVDRPLSFRKRAHGDMLPNRAARPRRTRRFGARLAAFSWACGLPGDPDGW